MVYRLLAVGFHNLFIFPFLKYQLQMHISTIISLSALSLLFLLATTSFHSSSSLLTARFTEAERIQVEKDFPDASLYYPICIRKAL
jgi:hypothetical protein